MEPVRFWAAVEFTAQNSSTEELLWRAAQQGLHPYHVTALPGGFRAHCAAWHYRRFAALARRMHVRLRIRKKQGLFFLLRPILRRTGLWVGIAVFVPLLLWSQSLIWAVDYSTLTYGQQTRAAAALRSCALLPGAVVTEAKLTEGEYALLQSGEFSWASLNFAKGRLRVGAAAAKPKPAIASGTLHGIRARCSGTVTEVNLISGTMLVTPGQQVEEGQGLIGTARSERDGTLIFLPAAGSVRAQFEWQDNQSVPLEEQVLLPTGHRSLAWRCFYKSNFSSVFRVFSMQSDNTLQQVLWYQAHIGPLVLPFSVEETVFWEQSEQMVSRTEEQALALARLRSEDALYAAFPDAAIIARREDCSTTDGVLQYTAAYTVTADICT